VPLVIMLLLKNHKSIILHLKNYTKTFAEDFHDLGITDFVVGLSENYEKMAWFYLHT
jgi:starvation-inducible DNA-binding protein